MRNNISNICGIAAVAVSLVWPGGPPASAAPVPAAAKLPDTIPSFSGWQAGSGTWQFTAGTVVVRDEALARGAQLLVDELNAYLKGSGVTGAAASDAPSTVRLVVDASRKGRLGAEGYELAIAATGATITAADRRGVFWGTRTLSQMLRQQQTLPVGRVVDIPRYPERGLTLCACQINISPEWIDRLLNEMADLKMNYLLVELKMKSQKHPEANTWSYYTRDEIRDLVGKAEAYGIDVIPEINSPGHMNIWLEGKPQLQLTDKNGNKQVDRLDLSKPEAVRYYLDLIDEYQGVFKSKYWHVGADEYMIGSSFANFPDLTAWAQRKWGAQATIADAFIDFVNQVNAHVKAKGMTLRMWNDGYIDTRVVKLDKDIIIEFWLGSGRRAQTVADEGYKLMNANADLYYSRGVPTAYRIQAQGPSSLYGKWAVDQFPGGQSLGAANPAILGAKISLWPDNGVKQTENEVEKEIFDALRFGSQMFWAGSIPQDNPTWGAFKARIDSIGRSPMWDNSGPMPLADGVYTITSKAGQGLAVTAAGVGVGESASWSLVATPDHYYQIKSVETGRCLGVYTGDKHLETVTQIGAAVEAAECADPQVQFTVKDQGDFRLRNPQKWQLIRTAPGADTFRLRNAVTLQYLAVATGREAPSVDFGADNARRPAAGSVVQLPADMTVEATSVFTIVPDKRALRVKVSADRTVAYPAAAVPEGAQDDGVSTIPVVVGNAGAGELAGVVVTPGRVPGWEITPASITLERIAPAADATAQFQARPTWKMGEQALTFTAAAAGSARSASVMLKGLTGPTITPTAVGGSSQEAQGEGPNNGRYVDATDGNPATFWHSQWQGGLRRFPHWIDLDLGQARQVSAMVYTPRSGKNPNGRIKEYEIYTSQDGRNWSPAPVAKGSLPDGTGAQVLPVQANARYFRLKGLNAQPSAADRDVMSAVEIALVVGAVPAAPASPAATPAGTP